MTGRHVYHPTDPSKDQFFLDGKPVSRAEYERRSTSRLDFSTPPGGQRPACWPMVSDAMLVHPDQLPEMRARALAAGVPTDYTREGQPILRDPKHRKEYCRKVEGCIDRNASYGDPQ